MGWVRRRKRSRNSLKGEKRDWLVVPRRIANAISLCAFVFFLILFLVILLHSSQRLPATATTVSSTLQVVKGSHGVTQSTQTTQKTVSDVTPSIWLTLLGRDQGVFLSFGASILAAYVLAAILQRVLLGKYAISVGPFSVPDITEGEVKEAVDAALFAAGAEGTDEPPPEGTTESQPVWMGINDPNLTLAGWRIDLEREIRRIAARADFPENQQQAPLRRLLGMLATREVIPYDVLKPLDQLLTFANEGVHGAKVDPDVVDIIRTQGFQLLRYLRSIDAWANPEMG
jgi:hypothetical protein